MANDDFFFSNFVRSDPNTAAMLSKAVPNDRMPTTRDNQGNRQTNVPDLSHYRRNSARRGKANADARTIMKILPDTDMSLRILVSSILSPSDMTTTEIAYKAPSGIFASELSNSLISHITEHFEQDYKVKTLLPEMLRDILGEKGSYPVAVIPENAIDAFINGQLEVRPATEADIKPFITDEGLPRNVGILGSGRESDGERVRGLSMEAFRTADKPGAIDPYIQIHIRGETYEKDQFVTVTDNITVLKFPLVHERIKHARIQQAMIKRTRAFSLESEIDSVRVQMGSNKAVKNLSDLKVEQNLYPINRQFQHEITARLQGQAEMQRRSVGSPLCMKFPSESVLPVHVPGNPKKHIGYFVLLDNEGNPISMSTEDAYNESIGNGLGPGADNSLGNTIMRKINANFGDRSSFDMKNRGSINYATHIYADIVERDLLARIRNGIHSTSAQIATSDEFYRVMLARSLQRKFTQILYIPLEYMTYVAFNYDDHGIGRSLMDETSTINTLRSVLQFNDVIAAVRNAIGRTSVKMTLDESDPDPWKTIEEAQHDVVRSRQLDLPMSVTNPSDITEFLSRAGFDWSFTGHPSLPKMEMEFSQNNTQYPKADTELSEALRKQSIMGFSLSPETVDNGWSGQLATSVVASNILLGKRVLQYQQDFTPQVAAHLRKYMVHHQPLLESLQDIIRENKDKIKYQFTEDEKRFIARLDEARAETYKINRTLKEFLDGFEVSLPEPPTVTLENQMSNFDTYTQGIEKAVEFYLSQNLLTGLTAGDELSGQVDSIKAMIVSYFARAWLTEHGVMPELGGLIAKTEDGAPQIKLMEEMTRHIEAMVRSCTKVAATVTPMGQAAQIDMEKIKGGEDTSGGDEFGSGEETPPEDNPDENTGGGEDDFGTTEDNEIPPEQPTE